MKLTSLFNRLTALVSVVDLIDLLYTKVSSIIQRARLKRSLRQIEVEDLADVDTERHDLLRRIVTSLSEAKTPAGKSLLENFPFDSLSVEQLLVFERSLPDLLSITPSSSL